MVGRLGFSITAFCMKNKNTEKDVMILESGGFLSLATNLGGITGPMIIEGAPSSTATNRKIE